MRMKRRFCLIAVQSLECCLTFSFSFILIPRLLFVVFVADNSEEGEVEEEETNPTITQHPLRRAGSDDHLRQQFEEGKKAAVHRNKFDRETKSHTQT